MKIKNKIEFFRYFFGKIVKKNRYNLKIKEKYIKKALNIPKIINIITHKYIIIEEEVNL